MIRSTLRKLTAAAALLLAGFALVAPSVAFAQDAKPAAETPAKAPGGHGEKKGDKTLLDTYNEGGPVMHIIAITSILMVWLIVDGYMRTTTKKVYPETQVSQLRELFKSGDYVAAYNFSKTHSSPFSDVVRAGLSYSPEGKTLSEEAMISELERVKASFDSRISYLSVIGVCTPMIGLTGTVIGMRGAFEALGKSGAGDAGALSGHIGEVLVATGSGLVIAIPAFVSYYLLRNRVTQMMHDLQELVGSLYRNMPYDDLAGASIGDEEIYAAKPVWNSTPVEGEATPAA